MTNHAARFAAIIALALANGELPAVASPILGVIDVASIRNRHPGGGNSLGVAYSPVSDVLYLSDFVTPPAYPSYGGYIYTLDLQGHVLNEVDFQEAYHPQWYPTSLSYDTATGHLFVQAYRGDPGAASIVEMNPDGTKIFNEFTIPTGGGGGIHVRADGIWQSLFASDTIRHYTRDGALLEEISVAKSFPGLPGPEGLASSFRGGFFILDSYKTRVVEAEIGGKEIQAVSTASLSSRGNFLSIDSDVNTERLFLQNNVQIYVLSSEFVAPVPEPGAFSLFLIGSAGLLASAWWQRTRLMRPKITRWGGNYYV